MKKFGIVTPWINIKNAEFELIERIKIAAKNIGVNCVVFDNNGIVLDENQLSTNTEVNAKELDFILSLHYESPKFLDSFYYGVLWNPPLYILKATHLGAVDNYSMYDAFIGYDSDPILTHAKAMLDPYKTDIYRDLDFTGSPANIMYEPDFSDPKMFYCGINWEKCLKQPGRHTEILRQLEETGDLKIFGPDKFLNVRPWEDFTKSYSGEIPFDGISLIKEVHDCGVVLFLSSDEHKKYDVVTNRIYEAAAAGAIVISDNKKFVLKYFGDSVLTIDYEQGSDQKEVAQQILTHFEWIKNNKEKAVQKAKKMQKIFQEKFCMEKQLQNLFEKHNKIKEQAEKKTLAKSHKDTVDIILKWEKNNLDGLETTISYINNQYYNNLNLIACFDSSIAETAEQILRKNTNKEIAIKTISLDIYNNNLNQNTKGYKKLTSGEIILEAVKYVKSDYIGFADDNTIWLSDHITTLKRTFEDNENINMTYSGVFSKEYLKDQKIYYRTLSFKSIFEESLKIFNSRITLSSCLIKKTLLQKYSDGCLNFIDGLEFYLFAFHGLINKDAVFSKRMTSGNINVLNQSPIYHMSTELQTDFIKEIFKNDIYFNNTHLYSNMENTDYNNFIKMLILSLRKKLLKKRPIARTLAKLFFGKKQWKLKNLQ